VSAWQSGPLNIFWRRWSMD